MASSKAVVLNIYKSMLHEAGKFSSYNFRMYAQRRTRDAFRANKSVTDPEKIRSLIVSAQNNLKMMQRQTAIHNMYQTDRLCIETDVASKRESALGP